jgi:hypothetical protein
MRGTPIRLPYCPCDSLPGDEPPSRSSPLSWSLSKESATATRAPPGQDLGFSEHPARTFSTMPRQRASGHCQGRSSPACWSGGLARAVVDMADLLI